MRILHGENIVESRKALREYLEKAAKEGIDVVVFDKKVTFSEIRSALESGSLLGKNRLAVLENFLSVTKSQDKEKIINYLAEGKFDNDITLWEEKQINKIPFLKADVELFKVDPLIFRFLESLRPGGKGMLDSLARLKKKEEPEMIFYMLARQFRLLLMAKDNTLALPSWQKGKLENQAKYFDKEKLKKIYAQLLEIDHDQKTSQDPFSLSSRLDLFVASI